jgi:fructoselysine 6-phosphate deglycase
MTLQEIVKQIKAKADKTGGVKQVYFVACGGSLAAFYPAKYLLESESNSLKVGYYTSSEFVHSTPKVMGKNSIVIACSHQGTTPETVEAAKLSKQRGAAVIAFSYNKGSELAQNGDYEIIYEWGPDSKIENQKVSYGLKLAFEILHQTEGYENYDKAMEAFSQINDIVIRAKNHVARSAEAFSEKYKDENFIYTMGSGASYGSAHIESICILLEMQWINSASFHSGEFFHGPLEITDAETPFILLISEGKTRPLDERALNFLEKYGKKFIVIDAKELGINEINDSVVEFFNPLLFTNVLDVYNRALAAARKHPLTTRRYMWKVSY